MGYRIIYEDEKSKKRWTRLLILSLVFFGLFVGWTFRCWPEGRETMFLWLFPCRAGEAVSVLEEYLNMGQDAAEAVSAFCRTLFFETGEIIY